MLESVGQGHMIAMRYRVALHSSEEGFSVSVPGLPGCWSQGDSEAEAIENIKAAIHDYLSVVDEQLRDEDVREIEITV
jgi:predicted RNase H-like HicB family nuclease